MSGDKSPEVKEIARQVTDYLSECLESPALECKRCHRHIGHGDCYCPLCYGDAVDPGCISRSKILEALKKCTVCRGYRRFYSESSNEVRECYRCKWIYQALGIEPEGLKTPKCGNTMPPEEMLGEVATIYCERPSDHKGNHRGGSYGWIAKPKPEPAPTYKGKRLRKIREDEFFVGSLMFVAPHGGYYRCMATDALIEGDFFEVVLTGHKDMRGLTYSVRKSELWVLDE